MDWEEFYTQHNLSITNIDKYISNPSIWQKRMVACLNRFINQGYVLEAGCGYGLISLLIGNRFDRTLLDYESQALVGARSVFTRAKQHANFILGSVFDLPFDNESFDLVFNTGVLEHFTFEERRLAVTEMARVAKKGGFIIIAVPNHFSIPYRYAYEKMKSDEKWICPDERRVYDLQEEIETVPEIKLIRRETFDIFTSILFVKNNLRRVRFIFEHCFRNYEGYLTVLIHKKV